MSRMTAAEPGRMPFSAAAPAVRFDNVGMRYGRGTELLRDISFDLPPGAFQFLTGASGAGKSSLLKLIYMSHRVSRGTISLFGRDMTNPPRGEIPFLRRRIGMVFQDYRLLGHLSVFDNAALPLRLAGIRPADYHNDVAELLTWVGLGRRFNALPSALAGGEQQRLAIARAVVARPELLLVDEPTGNIDAEMGQRILRLLMELNNLGTTVLIATHDHDLIAKSDRPVMHLEGGRLSGGPAGAPQ